MKVSIFSFYESKIYWKIKKKHETEVVANNGGNIALRGC